MTSLNVGRIAYSGAFALAMVLATSAAMASGLCEAHFNVLNLLYVPMLLWIYRLFWLPMWLVLTVATWLVVSAKPATVWGKSGKITLFAAPLLLYVLSFILWLLNYPISTTCF